MAICALAQTCPATHSLSVCRAVTIKACTLSCRATLYSISPTLRVCHVVQVSPQFHGNASIGSDMSRHPPLVCVVPREPLLSGSSMAEFTHHPHGGCWVTSVVPQVCRCILHYAHTGCAFSVDAVLTLQNRLLFPANKCCPRVHLVYCTSAPRPSS